VASSPLDVGEWIGIVGLVSAAVGWIAAWIRRYVNSVKVRIDLLEVDMKEWDKLHAAHNTQLAVVENCQEHTRVTLEKIQETAVKVDDKLDKVLLALVKAGP
jgi:hypothetical protein